MVFDDGIKSNNNEMPPKNVEALKRIGNDGKEEKISTPFKCDKM